jgi:hypothetical protein
MDVDGTVDAQRKITFALNSKVSFVSVSITRTPVALFLSASYMTSWTIEFGLRVILPVASAAGSVEELLLKYAPYGQPLLHLDLY